MEFRLETRHRSLHALYRRAFALGVRVRAPRLRFRDEPLAAQPIGTRRFFLRQYRLRFRLPALGFCSSRGHHYGCPFGGISLLIRLDLGTKRG